jgi:hypothetical protein
MLLTLLDSRRLTIFLKLNHRTGLRSKLSPRRLKNLWMTLASAYIDLAGESELTKVPDRQLLRETQVHDRRPSQLVIPQHSFPRIPLTPLMTGSTYLLPQGMSRPKIRK